jgi:hypothetical protein
MRRRVIVCHVAASLLFVLLLSACRDAPAAREDNPVPVAEQTTGVIDWDRRAVSFRAPGWTIEFCEGDGPFLCVAGDGGRTGSVELLRTPVHYHSVIADVLGRGGSEIEALQAAAADFVAALSADRRVGLGEDYRMTAEAATEATVMGKQGLRVVVDGRIGDRILERVVHYHVIQRDTAYLLGASAAEGGGPLGEFTIEELRGFEPVFARIAATSRVHTISR